MARITQRKNKRSPVYLESPGMRPQRLRSHPPSPRDATRKSASKKVSRARHPASRTALAACGPPSSTNAASALRQGRCLPSQAPPAAGPETPPGSRIRRAPRAKRRQNGASICREPTLSKGRAPPLGHFLPRLGPPTCGPFFVTGRPASRWRDAFGAAADVDTSRRPARSHVSI